MARYDFEDLLVEVESIMTTNLNTKLTALDAEKNDGIVLKQVSDSAYVMQAMNDKIMNFDPFIIYGVTDVETSGSGPQIAEKVLMSAIIVVADNGAPDLFKRMFRYSRALKEIFQDNWQNHNYSNRIRVSRTNVVSFESLDTSDQFKATGVEIEINIAS